MTKMAKNQCCLHLVYSPLLSVCYFICIFLLLSIHTDLFFQDKVKYSSFYVKLKHQYQIESLIKSFLLLKKIGKLFEIN